MKIIFSAVIYMSAIVAANWSVFFFGPLSTPVNAFLLIGLDLVIRDHLHTRLGFLPAVSISVLAGAISYFTNPAIGVIAVASVTAFSAAAITDSIVYQYFLRKKWMVRANASNIAGAAVDSAVFPLIAFGTFMPWVVLAQFAAKTAGGFVWSLLLKRK